MTTDEWGCLTVFLVFVAILIGACIGMYSAHFSIPSIKIWDSPRSYDHILIADDVVCNDANVVNATYWQYDVIKWNNTDYVYKQVQTDNESAMRVIICTGGRT